MHVGLIGGIGVAATDFYYRGLIEAMKARKAELNLTIVHADAPTLVRNFEARQPEAQADVFLTLTERLVSAIRAKAATRFDRSRPLNPR